MTRPIDRALEDALRALALNFADALLGAVCGASIRDLRENLFAPPKEEPERATPRLPGSAPRSMARRSAAELERIADRIVALLLRKHPEGLRAEELRDELGLASRELPRPLLLGLTSRRLRKTGEKRTTTYFAR